MSRETRKALIEAIQEKRKSKVIVYFTGDRPNLSLPMAGDIIPIIHDHILAMEPEERKKIDLLIYSRGGDSDAPWSLVSMFREYCQEGSFSILVPYRAHSAATVIALGADEIVMTKKAELGPIDITIPSGPYNPVENGTHQRLPVSVEDVMGYFSLLEKIGCERPNEKMRGFEQLTNKVHPLVLGSVSRLLQQTQLVALRLLSTRSDAFSEEKNQEIVKRLSSEIYSHRHTISRTEAINYLDLKQVVKAEDVGISDELWELYNEYREYLLLDEPFMPENYLIENNLDEYEWENLNLICIESELKSTVSRRNVKLKRLRQMPPQITLNLQNVNLPAVNIPNVSLEEASKLVNQLIPQIMQPIIDHAAQVAAKKFIESLPSSQFERIEYNVKWDTEE